MNTLIVGENGEVQETFLPDIKSFYFIHKHSRY